MCNQGNAHDIATFPDISSTKRSEPTSQTQININLQQFLEHI